MGWTGCGRTISTTWRGVTLTGERESYLAAYRGGAQELAVVLRDGWLYQGQIDPLTGEPKGTRPGDLPPHACVYSIQNHDQVGNRPFGERLHHDISPAAYRAASTLLLFAPVPRCCSWVRNGRHPLPSSSSPITSQDWVNPSPRAAEGTWRFCRFPRAGDPRPAGGNDLLALKAELGRAGPAGARCPC